MRNAAGEEGKDKQERGRGNNFLGHHRFEIAFACCC
jgi:hypothetical protein